MRGSVLIAACIIACAGSAAWGQSTGTVIAESASPFAVAAVSNDDAAGVAMPVLAYTLGADDAQDFDKYFYFHRPQTDFATAHADITECDGYAQGLSSGMGYQQVPYPYAGTLGGVIGGAIGNALANAIFGSGEKRRVRRLNMRQCMHFKGYDRYGLPKSVWETFNFEEGHGSVEPARRALFLKQQALVAATATPTGEVIGL